jgi:diguanylate cyclase (GGDEF)-like protein
MKLTIAKKMFIGYLTMALLTVVVGIYVLQSLTNLNQITNSLLKEEFEIINKSKTMMDDLFAQERSEKRFFILQDKSIEQLFWDRSKEFKVSLLSLKALLPFKWESILSEISDLHEDYDSLFLQEVRLIVEKRNEEASEISKKELKEKMDTMVMKVRHLETIAEESIDEKMKVSHLEGRKALNITFSLCLLSLLIGIFLAFFFTYTFSSPIKKLGKATQFIAQGDFDFDPKITSGDEVGELAQFFRNMAKRLKELEELNIDASPLTRLPGNVAIERTLNELLREKKPFALCHTDLDNFKPFADKYGYAWASEVIKEVAAILKEAASHAGEDGDFVGHIGGDDFVLITPVEHIELLGERIRERFKEVMHPLYSEKDRTRGYVETLDRQGHLAKFPLMTVSVSAVANEGYRLVHYSQFVERLADLKSYAKSLGGDLLVRDRRLQEYPRRLPLESTTPELRIRNGKNAGERTRGGPKGGESREGDQRRK